MRSVTLVLVFVLSLISEAYPGEYRLIKGREFELCRAMEKNLNSFKDEPPMVCERKFKPEFKDFRVPKWEPLDPRENMDLLEQIYKSKYMYGLGGPEDIAREFAQERWLKFKPELERQVTEGQVFLSKARFDLAHKGEEVTVLKLADNDCDPIEDFDNYAQPDPTLHVVNDKTRKLDPRYKSITDYPAEPFFYQGRIRLARWWGNPNLRGPELNVYETFWTLDEFGIPIHPVCTYQYLK